LDVVSTIKQRIAAIEIERIEADKERLRKIFSGLGQHV
jgi:hypothetical protein